MDANAPRSRIVIHEKTVWKIARRWQELQPRLKLELQVRPSHICYDEAWHRDWMLDLLAKKIEMRVIKRLDLDDPRCTRSVLTQRVTMYLNRRKRRKKTCLQVVS